MAQINTAEIHVLSLDGGGSRGIMESIMLGHVMDLSTLMTAKPSHISVRSRSTLRIVKSGSRARPKPVNQTDRKVNRAMCSSLHIPDCLRQPD